MRYRSLDSLLPILKIQSGNPNIDQFLPELAQLVPVVERNLGLSNKALHKMDAINVEISRGQGLLPVGFFEEDQILDMCLDRRLLDLSCCNCRCKPCHCGYSFIHENGGVFHFHDQVIDAPYSTGTVSFSYWSLELDREGLPMVYEGHVEAFNAYICQLFKQGEMNSGTVSPAIFRENERVWDKQSLITRSRDNVPKFYQVRLAADVTGSPLKFLLRD